MPDFITANREVDAAWTQVNKAATELLQADTAAKTVAQTNSKEATTRAREAQQKLAISRFAAVNLGVDLSKEDTSVTAASKNLLLRELVGVKEVVTPVPKIFESGNPLLSGKNNRLVHAKELIEASAALRNSITAETKVDTTTIKSNVQDLLFNSYAHDLDIYAEIMEWLNQMEIIAKAKDATVCGCKPNADIQKQIQELLPQMCVATAATAVAQ